MKKVSYNFVRGQLRKGFKELLEALPEGDEEVLFMDEEVVDGEDSVLLILLEEYTKAVHALKFFRGLDAQEIKSLMEHEGIMQNVLLGDDKWAQVLID